jgi:hypothetical protein
MARNDYSGLVPCFGSRPLAQLGDGFVMTHRAPLDPQLEQVAVSSTDHGPRLDPEDGHDLVAVQIRPDALEILLLGQLSDAPLE